MPAFTNLSLDKRASVLRDCGVAEAVIPALLEHNALGTRIPLTSPLPADPLSAYWGQMLTGHGLVAEEALHFLAGCYPAVCFPVDDTLHTTSHYQAALAGSVPPPALDIALWHDVQRLEVRAEQTMAGCVPVIIAGGRSDFERLLQCLARRNRAARPPANVGAMYINGLVNISPTAQTIGDSRKDRVILLSRGPYAGLSAEEAGQGGWTEMSLRLRMRHELLHYVLHQARGLMSKSLTEEVLADVEAVRLEGVSEPVDLAIRVLGANQNQIGGPRFIHYLPQIVKNQSHGVAELIRRAVVALFCDEMMCLNDSDRLLLLSSFTLEELAAQHIGATAQKNG